MSKRKRLTTRTEVPDDVWQCILDQVPLDDATTVLNLLGVCRTIGRMLWPRIREWLTIQCALYSGAPDEQERLTCFLVCTFPEVAQFWNTARIYAQRKELALVPVSKLFYIFHLSHLQWSLFGKDGHGIASDEFKLDTPLSKAFCLEGKAVTPLLKMDAFRVIEFGAFKYPYLKRVAPLDRHGRARRAKRLWHEEEAKPGSFMEYTKKREITYREMQPTDAVCDLVTLVAQHNGPRLWLPVWLGRHPPWWHKIYSYPGTPEQAKLAIPFHIAGPRILDKEMTYIDELHVDAGLPFNKKMNP